MSKSSHELLNEVRERLLLAGIAPRHVRRYVNELADHLADLKSEEERAGRSPADVESAALMRLGSMNDLARAMTERKEFQSWCVRAPWAMFGLVPILFLAGAYLIALLILWSGWRIFLPGNDTPFVPTDGFSIFYFGVGRLLYFVAPVLVGWGIGLIAARQRLKAVWPTVGFLLIGLMGGAARVQASRTAVPSGLGHIRMDFAFGPSVQGSLFHALVIFSLAALPYLIWRFQKARFFSA
jgi:hypothetical protein